MKIEMTNQKFNPPSCGLNKKTKAKTKELRLSFVSLLSLFIFCFLFLAAAPRARAASAILYLSPSSGSFLVGSTFTVSVFLNTNGNSVNTVWADINFPPEILQVASPTAGSSFISNWLTPPSYSNQAGVISFRGGIPGGISTSAGLVSSITFRAISAGDAKIEFSTTSKILLNDGQGTNILNNSIGGDYQILVPPPEGPQVYSPTHPDPDIWYSNSSPEFSWTKENDVSGFSWSFSQNPLESPPGVSNGTNTLISYSNVKDGIWYFHIRQEKNGVWGQTSNVQVKIDTTPPDNFTPKVVTYSDPSGFQTLVYFNTTDNYSGISHYEVSLVNLSSSGSQNSFFTEQTSPYKIPNVKPGKYDVIIRAIDNAGNIRQSDVVFRVATPLFSYVAGQGIDIKGIVMKWPIFWVMLGGFFCLLCVLFWWQIKSRRKMAI